MPKISELPNGGTAQDSDWIAVSRAGRTVRLRIAELRLLNPPGPPGPPGQSLHTGLGPPADSIGREADTYVDLNTGVVYTKG